MVYVTMQPICLDSNVLNKTANKVVFNATATYSMTGLVSYD